MPRTRRAEILTEWPAGDEWGLRVANVFTRVTAICILWYCTTPTRARACGPSSWPGDRGVVHGNRQLVVGRARCRRREETHDGENVSQADLATMQRVRAAFDPVGLCNPGKVFPTPRLCGERPGKYQAHPLEAAGKIERI